MKVVMTVRVPSNQIDSRTPPPEEGKQTLGAITMTDVSALDITLGGRKLLISADSHGMIISEKEGEV